MRLVIQRVQSASVSVHGESIASIGTGLLALIGFHQDDQIDAIHPLITKMVRLRIFADSAGKMNRSLIDISGELLLVSQFTLCADCSSGLRPSFTRAKPSTEALEFYLTSVESARRLLSPERVATGEFGADMKVSLVNEGPFTIIL